MNRKQQQPREQDEIRILGRKLEQRFVPEEVQKLSEKADGLEESFNSRKLKAWHMMQEADAAGDLRTLKMIDKLTAQYDMVSCSDDTADFMERSHGNDILEAGKLKRGYTCHDKNDCTDNNAAFFNSSFHRV